MTSVPTLADLSIAEIQVHAEVSRCRDWLARLPEHQRAPWSGLADAVEAHVRRTTTPKHEVSP
jgi:hypothetical protein